MGPRSERHVFASNEQREPTLSASAHEEITSDRTTSCQGGPYLPFSDMHGKIPPPIISRRKIRGDKKDSRIALPGTFRWAALLEIALHDGVWRRTYVLTQRHCGLSMARQWRSKGMGALISGIYCSIRRISKLCEPLSPPCYVQWKRQSPPAPGAEISSGPQTDAMDSAQSFHRSWCLWMFCHTEVFFFCHTEGKNDWQCKAKNALQVRLAGVT